jgi:hypothetical protein
MVRAALLLVDIGDGGHQNVYKSCTYGDSGALSEDLKMASVPGVGTTIGVPPRGVNS